MLNAVVCDHHMYHVGKSHAQLHWLTNGMPSIHVLMFCWEEGTNGKYRNGHK